MPGVVGDDMDSWDGIGIGLPSLDLCDTYMGGQHLKKKAIPGTSKCIPSIYIASILRIILYLGPTVIRTGDHSK